GAWAVPSLQEALKAKPSLETARRLEQVLQKVDAGAWLRQVAPPAKGGRGARPSTGGRAQHRILKSTSLLCVPCARTLPVAPAAPLVGWTAQYKVPPCPGETMR